MSRRRQRQRDKRRQHALASRDRLQLLLYDVKGQPLQHRQLFASHLYKISRRHRIRLSSESKGLICRKCSSLLVYGSTARIRLRNGLKINQCLKCGYTRRVPYKLTKEVLL